MAEGKHEEALEFIGQAMELKPSSFKLLRLRSMAYACLHKYPKSLADAEKLIALQSTSTDGYYHKGFALYQMQDYSGAAHAFRHGLKLNPTDKVLHQGFWDSLTLLSQHRVKNPYVLCEVRPACSRLTIPHPQVQGRALPPMTEGRAPGKGGGGSGGMGRRSRRARASSAMSSLAV